MSVVVRFNRDFVLNFSTRVSQPIYFIERVLTVTANSSYVTEQLCVSRDCDLMLEA